MIIDISNGRDIEAEMKELASFLLDEVPLDVLFPGDHTTAEGVIEAAMRAIREYKLRCSPVPDYADPPALDYADPDAPLSPDAKISSDPLETIKVVLGKKITQLEAELAWHKELIISRNFSG